MIQLYIQIKELERLLSIEDDQKKETKDALTEVSVHSLSSCTLKDCTTVGDSKSIMYMQSSNKTIEELRVKVKRLAFENEQKDALVGQFVRYI